MASTSDLAIEDKRLLSRVDDAVRLSDRRGIPRFVGFFDERQAAAVKQHLRHHHPQTVWKLEGGHPQAERVYLGVFPDELWCRPTAFPFTSLVLRYRSSASITHRDVLGSVLGCGVERDKIGDILIGNGFSVVFVAEELADYLTDSLDKIGREGVTVSYPYEGNMPALHSFAAIDGTVASPRLDAVLKVILGVSREQAAELIRSERVRLNHISVVGVSATVHENDVVSVSGYGRFVVDDLSDLSKKGRVILRARKYV